MSASTADLFVGIVPFVATAELRSVCLVVCLLGITPSLVSRAIFRLEAVFGIRLLHRTPRIVTLTPEGELFYRDCQLAVAGVRNARAAVSAALAAPRGRLRVSLPLALGELVVMPALPRLVSRHPGLSIEAIITDRYVDLASENIDAVVRIGAPRSTGLKRHRLPAIRWATVASPAYLAARGMPRTPDELARHNCLHFVLPNGTTQAWQFAGRRGVARIATAGNLAGGHPGGLLRAAVAGLGLVQVHAYTAASALADGRLVEVLADAAPPALPMAVLYPAGRERSANIRAFVEEMVELTSRSGGGA